MRLVCVYVVTPSNLHPQVEVVRWSDFAKGDKVYTTRATTHPHSRGQDLIRGWLTSSGNNLILRVRVCMCDDVYLSVSFSVFNIPGCSFLGNTVCSLWGDHWGLLVSMLSTLKHTPWSLTPHVFYSLPLLTPRSPSPRSVLWRSASTTLFLIWKVSPFHAGHSSQTDQSSG